MKNKALFEAFDGEFKNQIKGSVNYRTDDSDTNRLGILNGLEIENEHFSAYVYHWSKGFVHYSAVDVKTGDTIIPIDITEYSAKKLHGILEKISELFNSKV